MLTLKQVQLQHLNFRLTAELTLATGKAMALMGPSGSGKSTLLNAIAGFVPLHSGVIHFQGQRIDPLSPQQRPLTVLFQSHNCFSHLTVWHNIAIGLSPAMILDDQQKLRLSSALTDVGLEGFEQRMPGSLSGGQLQRVALARALLRKKPLLLLDEPFTGLDQDNVTHLYGLINQLRQQHNLSLIMSTHDERDAAALCDSIHRLG